MEERKNKNEKERKKYILTEYTNEDLPILLDEFNNLEEVKKYIEKKENNKISLSLLKHRSKLVNNLICGKYFITLD